MKIGLTEIAKVTAQAKCYFDKTFANPYSNIKIRIYLKKKSGIHHIAKHLLQ